MTKANKQSEAANATPDIPAQESSQIPETPAPAPAQVPVAEDEYGYGVSDANTPAAAPAPVASDPAPALAPVPAAPAPIPAAPATAPVPAPAAPVAAEDREWEDATSSDYVEFTEPAIVTFLSENFASVPGDGGRISWEFDVLQTINGEMVSKILGTRSKRLMRGLKAFRPLTNRKLLISRTGEGYQTQYVVKELR